MNWCVGISVIFDIVNSVLKYHINFRLNSFQVGLLFFLMPLLTHILQLFIFKRPLNKIESSLELDLVKRVILTLSHLLNCGFQQHTYVGTKHKVFLSHSPVIMCCNSDVAPSSMLSSSICAEWDSLCLLKAQFNFFVVESLLLFLNSKWSW